MADAQEDVFYLDEDTGNPPPAKKQKKDPPDIRIRGTGTSEFFGRWHTKEALEYLAVEYSTYIQQFKSIDFPLQLVRLLRYARALTTC